MISTILDVVLISGAVWLAAAVAFFGLSHVYKDYMALKFSLAFACIGVGRLLFLVHDANDSDLVFGLILLLRIIAAYLLVDGSLNGSPRFKATKYWMAIALAVSGGYAVHNHTIGGDTLPFSIGPLAFALSAGFVFGAVRFCTCTGGMLAQDDWAYKVLCILFTVKAFTAATNVVLKDPMHLLIFGVLDIIIPLMLIWAGTFLMFDRHRARLDCNRGI